MMERENEEVFYPGNRALVSDQQDALVTTLKEVNDRFAGAWRVGATSDPRQRRAGARHRPSRRTPVSPRECWRGLA